VESDLEITAAPEIRPGVRVRIRSGPLRGMDAWVESREKIADVHIRLDFIGQAAVVKVQAEDLELA
jgi:transcription antitermination factor NusG